MTAYIRYLKTSRKMTMCFLVFYSKFVIKTNTLIDRKNMAFKI